MMRNGIPAVAAALAALAGTISTAEARPHDFDAETQAIFQSHFSHGSTRYATTSYDRKRSARGQRTAKRTKRSRQYQEASYTSSGGSHSAGPRPRRWCGWWMRTQRGGGPHLNLARNWARWGSAAGPQVGAVVVWRHHVGEIVGRAANGQWLVRSGNDGGRVRTRARSLAGAIAFRM